MGSVNIGGIDNVSVGRTALKFKWERRLNEWNQNSRISDTIGDIIPRGSVWNTNKASIYQWEYMEYMEYTQTKDVL